jgi:hypothetical protein
MKRFLPQKPAPCVNGWKSIRPPQHGSWLNMAEIELAVLARQCLDRRMPTKELVTSEVAAWEAARNQTSMTVHWRFTTQDARITLKKLYPCVLP